MARRGSPPGNRIANATRKQARWSDPYPPLNTYDFVPADRPSGPDPQGFGDFICGRVFDQQDGTFRAIDFGRHWAKDGTGEGRMTRCESRTEKVFTNIDQAKKWIEDCIEERRAQNPEVYA
jgi:hypothetical protein